MGDRNDQNDQQGILLQLEDLSREAVLEACSIIIQYVVVHRELRLPVTTWPARGTRQHEDHFGVRQNGSQPSDVDVFLTHFVNGAQRMILRTDASRSVRSIPVLLRLMRLLTAIALLVAQRRTVTCRALYYELKGFDHEFQSYQAFQLGFQ
jgi:hypothetical protein